MSVKRILIGLAAVLVAGGAMAQYVATPTVHEGRPGESPELGRTGAFRIGTARVQMALAGRGQITGMSAVTGKLEAADRSLTVRYWYPADAAAQGHRGTEDGQIPAGLDRRRVGVQPASQGVPCPQNPAKEVEMKRRLSAMLADVPPTFPAE